jgi:ATP-dependent Clp protease protease subunit
MNNRDEFRKFAVKGQGLSGLGVDQYLHHVESQTTAQHYKYDPFGN